MSISFGNHSRLSTRSYVSLAEREIEDNIDENIVAESTRLSIGSLVSNESSFSVIEQGTSSLLASTFNSVNVLVGVGVLSLPFAFKVSGWIVGFVLLVCFMLLTNYTARIVTKCLDFNDDEIQIAVPDKMMGKTEELDEQLLADHATEITRLLPEESVPPTSAMESSFGSLSIRNKQLLTYSDIGEAAFRQKGKAFISVIFSLELFAAAVALIILISDSLKSLFPDISLIFFKLIAFAVVTPSLWIRNLQILSYGSFVGIVAVINLIGVVFLDGLTYTESPGSLINPADTNLLPPSIFNLPIVFGLVMAGFSGHAVFPNIYREMKEPKQFSKMLNISYTATFILYSCMASIGYLMFGDKTLDEITKNIAGIPGYNQALNTFTVWLIAVNPATKYALTLNPIAVTLEVWLSRIAKKQNTDLLSSRNNKIKVEIIPGLPFRIPFGLARISIRTIISSIVLAISIIFPGFERVIALLGSFFSFVVSVIFPLACYLKLYDRRLTRYSKAFNLSLLVISCLLALLGTIWSILPAGIVDINSRKIQH